MGIPGIYREIGQGDRVALSKIAVKKLESSGRPLRLAIDISIWQFEAQSAQGGLNPVLRTLYYRFLKLLSLSIQPLFVFDGPNKPLLKRNVKTTKNRAAGRNRPIIEMIDLFGFNHVIAPGEAEAECALLQKEGLVDSVLSEDVDTLMFGCTMSMRNWKDESGRGGKTPTHVDVYHSKSIKESKCGLDSEGMILVALMSGGDYATEGIPGCGIKTACEAARAGFGHDLLRIGSEDEAGFARWRERLNHELCTNESKFFRTKRGTLKVPESFPDKKILRYYTHPAISSASIIAKLKDSIRWTKPVDVQGLRSFVAEHLDWPNLTGAYKFIRGLAPAMLVHKLLSQAEKRGGCTDRVQQEEQEKILIEQICGKRTHDSTGGELEIRIMYTPTNMVDLDLDLEDEDESSKGLDSEVEAEEGKADESNDQPTTSPKKKREPSKYDPRLPEKTWILETFARSGVPLAVERWETEQRLPKTAPKTKTKAKGAASQGGMPNGALDAYVKITKPRHGGIQQATVMIKPSKEQEKDREIPAVSSKTLTLPIRQPVPATKTPLALGKPAMLPTSSSKPDKPPRKPASKADTRMNKKLDFPITKRRTPSTIDKPTTNTKKTLKDGSQVPSHDVIDLSSSPTVRGPVIDRSPPQTLNAKKSSSRDKLQAVKNIVLRESLPGSWKEARESDVGTMTPSRLHLGVTILDMTTNSQAS